MPASRVGEVTSGTFSPTQKVGIALALLDRSVSEGDEVAVDVRGRPAALPRGQAAVRQGVHLGLSPCDPAVIRARLTAQQLSGPKAPSCADVVKRMLAVQAQDPRGARLAVRSRSTRVTAADVDDALTDASCSSRWLNRGTLHLVTPDDYWWLHPLTTPQLATGNVRRLEQEGVSPAQAERGVDVVDGAVTDEGPQTRAQLRDTARRRGRPDGAAGARACAAGGVACAATSCAGRWSAATRPSSR